MRRVGPVGRCGCSLDRLPTQRRCDGGGAPRLATRIRGAWLLDAAARCVPYQVVWSAPLGAALGRSARAPLDRASAAAGVIWQPFLRRPAGAAGAARPRPPVRTAGGRLLGPPQSTSASRQRRPAAATTAPPSAAAPARPHRPPTRAFRTAPPRPGAPTTPAPPAAPPLPVPPRRPAPPPPGSRARQARLADAARAPDFPYSAGRSLFQVGLADDVTLACGCVRWIRRVFAGEVFGAL